MFFRGVLAYLVTMVELVIFFLFDCNYFLCFMRGLVFLVSVVVVELIVVLYLRGRLEAVVGMVVMVMVLVLVCEFLSWLVIVVCLEVALLEERSM